MPVFFDQYRTLPEALWHCFYDQIGQPTSHNVFLELRLLRVPWEVELRELGRFCHRPPGWKPGKTIFLFPFVSSVLFLLSPYMAVFVFSNRSFVFSHRLFLLSLISRHILVCPLLYSISVVRSLFCFILLAHYFSSFPVVVLVLVLRLLASCP